MNLVTRLLATSLTLLLIAEYLPGFTVEGFYTALVASVILGLFNIFLKPLLVILTFPITILSLGLFTFVINAALFWFTTTIVDGFKVETFWHALLGSLIITFVSSLLNKVLD
jgi:putative membrane protein